MDSGSDRQRIEQVVRALETGVGNAVDRDILAAVVKADFDRYAATARIQAFVPILVEREVRARILKHRMTSPQRAAPRGSVRATPNARHS